LTKKNTLAQKLKFTTGDPSAALASGRVDSWTDDKMFFCKTEKIVNAEKIRQGKDTEDRVLRIWYRPREVDLMTGDRVSVAGVVYSIYFLAERGNENWFDCKAVFS